MLVVIAMSFTLTSCNERVDPGFVAMVQTVDGIQPEVLQPGNHTFQHKLNRLRFQMHI